MPSSERVVLAAAVALVAVVLGYSVYGALVPGAATGAVPKSFTVNGRTYTFTYVATTQADRERGLMNRPVTDTTTMLFAFPSSGPWQFWMYDTNTSLDIIWVNAKANTGSVVYVVAGAQPCFDSTKCAVYSPTAPANYVIEAKAGFASANGIQAGTTIQFA